MADVRDIYAHVRSVQDAIWDVLDIHTAEGQKDCRCENCQFLERLEDMVQDALNIMEPDMVGEWRAPSSLRRAG